MLTSDPGDVNPRPLPNAASRHAGRALPAHVHVTQTIHMCSAAAAESFFFRRPSGGVTSTLSPLKCGITSRLLPAAWTLKHALMVLKM